MNIPEKLLYTKSHEWIDITGVTAKVGLTDYAQSQLGDLVFVNLPAVGDEVIAGDIFADVESVKAVSDVYSPVTGVVCAVNELLLDEPQAINETPYDSWLIEIENIASKDDLLTAQEYAALCEDE